MRLPWLLAGFLAAGSAAALAGDDRVGRDGIDDKTFSGIVRCMRACDPRDARELGMVPTGSEPTFDSRYECRRIDEGWAIDYSLKRAREAMHGGIDIPAPGGTPILAIADGEVVGLFDDVDAAVGIKVFLRHAPEDTGKPFWTYSEYAHLAQLPPLAIGQRLARGDVVGLTGNTGISGHEAREKAGGSNRRGGGKVRRDAIHFSIMYSDDPRYFVGKDHVVPAGGRWMDPVALYRPDGPYDSHALAAMADAEKVVDTPFVAETGEVVPPGTKLIWPYACKAK